MHGPSKRAHVIWRDSSHETRPEKREAPDLERALMKYTRGRAERDWVWDGVYCRDPVSFRR